MYQTLTASSFLNVKLERRKFVGVQAHILSTSGENPSRTESITESEREINKSCSQTEGPETTRFAEEVPQGVRGLFVRFDWIQKSNGQQEDSLILRIQHPSWNHSHIQRKQGSTQDVRRLLGRCEFILERPSLFLGPRPKDWDVLRVPEGSGHGGHCSVFAVVRILSVYLKASDWIPTTEGYREAAVQEELSLQEDTLIQFPLISRAENTLSI